MSGAPRVAEKFSYENWPRWFRAYWPDAQRRFAIVNAYRGFATQHPAMFADIALRNNVFTPIRERDPQLAAIAEGRRQCALEIFKLGNMDPHALFALTQVERKTGDRT